MTMRSLLRSAYQRAHLRSSHSQAILGPQCVLAMLSHAYLNNLISKRCSRVKSAAFNLLKLLKRRFFFFFFLSQIFGFYVRCTVHFQSFSFKNHRKGLRKTGISGEATKCFCKLAKEMAIFQCCISTVAPQGAAVFVSLDRPSRSLPLSGRLF